MVDAVYIFGASCSLQVGEMITFDANILGLNINDGNSPAVVSVIIWSALLCVSLCLPSEFGTKELADEAIVEPESNCPDTLKKGFNSKVWCLFYVLFISGLFTGTCSVYLQLLTMQLFHLKLIHETCCFGVGTIFVFLVYLAAYNATSYYNENSILALGIILQLPSVLLLFVYALLWRNVSFPFSYSLIIFICSGMPQIAFSFVGSLLSKITPLQHASTIQSLVVVDFSVALLVGPGISGLVFLQASLIAYSLGLFALCLVGLTWLCTMF